MLKNVTINMELLFVRKLLPHNINKKAMLNETANQFHITIVNDNVVSSYCGFSDLVHSIILFPYHRQKWSNHIMGITGLLRFSGLFTSDGQSLLNRDITACQQIVLAKRILRAIS